MSDQSTHVVVLTGTDCSDCGIVAWLSKVLESQRSGGRSFTLRGELEPERLRLRLAAANGNAHAAIDDAHDQVRDLQRRLDDLTDAAKAFYDDNGNYHENRDRLGALLYPTGDAEEEE